MEFYPGETCGCNSFEESIPNRKENALQSLHRKNALRNLTPESEKNHMIGLLFIVVGNVDEEQEPTDEMIHAQVDFLNRVYSQTESKITEQSPPSSLLVACKKPIGVRFYIKEIIRNCVLPSGQWHSYNGTSTMSRASTGGADPDRADRFLNVVISNYSTDGKDPFEWNAETRRFPNFTNAGFAAKPRSWGEDPSYVESLFYQRLYVQAGMIGGDEQTGVEPNHNQRYRDQGLVVPQYFWSGLTLIHELGHLLDLGHTWGETPSHVWDDPQIDYHQCDRDRQIPDLPENDGYFKGGIMRGQVTASTDIFRPPGVVPRNVCTAEDFITANPVPWSNIMNYGDDEVRTMFTDEQRKEVMSTLAFYPTYIPLTQRAAPIDLTNSSLNKVRSIGTGTRAYIGPTLVWEKIPIDEEIPNPPPVYTLTLGPGRWQKNGSAGCTRGNRYEVVVTGIHNIDDPGRTYNAQYQNATGSWIGDENRWMNDQATPNVNFDFRTVLYICAGSTSGSVTTRMRYKLSDGTVMDWSYAYVILKESEEEDA